MSVSLGCTLPMINKRGGRLVGSGGVGDWEENPMI